MARRAKGEGSLFHRVPKKCEDCDKFASCLIRLKPKSYCQLRDCTDAWLYQTSFTGPDGKRRRKTISAPTKTELRKKIKLMKTTNDSALIPEMTFGEWCGVWQGTYLTDTRIRPSTKTHYKSLLKYIPNNLKTKRTPYFFFIYTFGMGYAAAFAHVELAARQAGLKLGYINAVQMVDNYLPVFEMQNQIDTLPQKNVEGQIEIVCKDIRERKKTAVTITPETEAEMKMYAERLAVPILRKDMAQGYIVNENCIRCGICARVCPANNITVTDTVTFGNRCEVCYACLHNCPQNAIHLPVEQSSVRFRNEHVSLKDIIDANG